MADIDWDKINLAVRDQILGKVEDQVFQDFVLFNRMRMRGIKKKGGRKLSVKVSVGRNTNVMSYKGHQELNRDPMNPFEEMLFDWRLYSAAINISGHERLLVEGTDLALFEMIEEEVANAKSSLAERLNEDAYLDGTGGEGIESDIDGLANIIDDGTNYGTIGGLSRTTYPVLAAGYYANAGVDRPLTYKLANRSQSAGLAGARGLPTMALTTPDLLDKLKETMQPHQIVSDTSKPSLGFPNVLVNQTPVFADTYCTAGRFYWINEKVTELITHTKRDFLFVPFREPTGQDAAVAYIWWAGNLVCRKPAANVQLRDLDEESI